MLAGPAEEALDRSRVARWVALGSLDAAVGAAVQAEMPPAAMVAAAWYLCPMPLGERPLSDDE